MARRSQVMAAALLLLALVTGTGAAAAPVLQSDASASQPGGPAGFGSSVPATSSLLGGGATTPADDLPSVTGPTPQTPAGAASMPSRASSKPLADGTHRERANAGGKPPQPGTKPGAAGATAAADGAQLDPDLKEAAKLALELAHEIKEMVQPGDAGGTDGTGQATAASRAASASTERTAESGEGSPAPLEPIVDPLPAPPRAPSQAGPTAPEINLVLEAIKIVRSIVDHPFTWLLVALVVLGTLMVSFMRWQAEVEARRSRGRTTRRPSGSSRPGTGLRQGTSASAAETPAAPALSDDAPVRPRVRRRARP